MQRESLSRKKAILVLGMMMIGANSKKIANWQEPNCNVYASDGSCDKCSFRFWMTPEDGRCHQVNDQCKTWCQQTGQCTSCYGGYGLTSRGQCTIGGVETTPVPPPTTEVPGGQHCEEESCDSEQSCSSYDQNGVGSGKGDHWRRRHRQREQGRIEGKSVDSRGQVGTGNPDHCAKYEYVNHQTNQKQLSWFLGCQKVCTECEPKFYLDCDNVCQPNPKNCRKADRNGDCLKCRRGWEPNEQGECVIIENPIEHCDEYKYNDTKNNSFLKWFTGCDRVCAKCQRGYEWRNETKTCDRVNNIWRHPTPDSPKPPAVGSPGKSPSCQSIKSPSVKSPSSKQPSVKSVKSPSVKSPSCKSDKSPSCKSIKSVSNKSCDSPNGKVDKPARNSSPSRRVGGSQSSGKNDKNVGGANSPRKGKNPGDSTNHVRTEGGNTRSPNRWQGPTGIRANSPGRKAHTGGNVSNPDKAHEQVGAGGNSTTKRGPTGTEAPHIVREQPVERNEGKGHGSRNTQTDVGSRGHNRDTKTEQTVRSEGGFRGHNRDTQPEHIVRSEGGKGADNKSEGAQTSTGVRDTGRQHGSGRYTRRETGRFTASERGHKAETQRVEVSRPTENETKHPRDHVAVRQETHPQTKPARNPEVENQVRSQPETKKQEHAETRATETVRADDSVKPHGKPEDRPEERVVRNPNAENQLKSQPQPAIVDDTPSDTRDVRGRNGKKAETQPVQVVRPIAVNEVDPTAGKKGKTEADVVVRNSDQTDTVRGKGRKP